MSQDKTMILMDAPCKDKKGHYPDGVWCNYDCDRCGWNPAEIRRRTREENLRKEVAFLKDENGTPYKGVFVKKYVFKRRRY